MCVSGKTGIWWGFSFDLVFLVFAKCTNEKIGRDSGLVLEIENAIGKEKCNWIKHVQIPSTKKGLRAVAMSKVSFLLAKEAEATALSRRTTRKRETGGGEGHGARNERNCLNALGTPRPQKREHVRGGFSSYKKKR